MMLTRKQLEARKGKLTASRIAPLMTGDAEGILRLYRELIGEIEPENLDHVWAVRLGSATEALQLAWYEDKNGIILTRRGELVVHAELDWAAATLDAWETRIQGPFECKHVGGFEPAEVIVDRYQPQLQWQMWVTGASQCAFSVIRGAREPVVDYVERDDAYCAEMVTRAQHFMLCVAMREPPVAQPRLEPIKADKIINMTGNNQWANMADGFIRLYQSAATFEDAKATLKSLVPADAKICFGHGVRILRDRRGALHVKEDK
jgi:predicted phage-related endonuclease